MKITLWVPCSLLLVALLLGCENAEEAFVGDRLLELCDETYWVCSVSSGCTLDNDHYIEGVFPGTRRLVVTTEKESADLRIRLYLSKMESPGTELLIQLYEPNCILDTNLARAHMVDVDLFEEAGNDRTLIFELKVLQAGEHLLEIYSDASAEYLLVVEPK